MRKQLLYAVVLVFLLTFTVSATTISQPWGTDTNGVTRLEGFLTTPGTAFGTPGLTGPTGGVLNQPNSQYASMTANSPSSWTAGTGYTITVDSTVPSFNLDILEWNGASLQEQLRFVWNASAPDSYNSRLAYNGGLWSWNQPSSGLIDTTLPGSTLYNRDTVGSTDGSAVPEPMSFVLIGTGLVGLGLIGRLRRKTAANKQ